MKKFLSVAGVLIIFTMFIVPATFAQQGPSDCCKASRQIKWESGKVNDAPCTPASACTIAKDETIGPSGATCPMTGSAPDKFTEQWGIICVINTLNTIVDWIFTIMVVLAVLFAILGAFNILTAGGSPEKVNTGRNFILYAAIGLVVGLIARAVPSIVKAVMGF